eukprot:1178589-Prorocentrum_minimum.AAC.2
MAASRKNEQRLLAAHQASGERGVNRQAPPGLAPGGCPAGRRAPAQQRAHTQPRNISQRDKIAM